VVRLNNGMQSSSYHYAGLISCEDITHDGSHSPSAPLAPLAPYYPEDSSQYYPDYGYPSQPSYPESSFSSTLERQGLEIALGAPLVITAFVAALLGGFLSPMISSGLSRLGEYEIQWPEVKRKVQSIGRAVSHSVLNLAIIISYF
jgi:hypothetical protein